MQTLGHIYFNGEKLLVLARRTTIGNAFKLRKSGADGQHFEDEQLYLQQHAVWMIKRLKLGETIYL